MNPATGTFITMDEYAGSVFEPVSLHKYLYANANPVMNSDPTGYFTLGELNVSQAIENTLHNMLTPSFSMAMKWINFFASLCDVSNQIGKLLHNGGSLAAVIEAVGRGLLSISTLNLICKLNAFCPLIGPAVVAYGFGTQLERLNSAIEEGDYLTAGLVVVQLTTGLYSLFESCFTGDTLVAVEDGQKRIDEIEVGDKVWAYNVETGETELKAVTKVYVHSVDEILHLYTDEGDIDTTSNHPFYVIGKGWVAAGDLVEGDEVYNLDGTTSTILGFEIEVLDEPVLVYNLEVEDFHSYFVGCVPVLVHNYESQRYKPGKATGGEKLSNPAKVMSSDGRYGQIPKDVADKLNGKSFKSFDDFRKQFWFAFSESKYAGEFCPQGIGNMKNGHAPFAPNDLQYKSMDRYILHHITPISEGGGVYDLNNLMIVSPEYHQFIHYGG